MKGRRITSDEASNLRNVKPGDYWRDPSGVWYAACPAPVDEDGLVTALALLVGHRVTEHEDGTITVTPSIVVRGWDQAQEYHGWLERGEWRSA